MPRALEKVLYVDDEPMLCRVVKVALEKVGGLTVETVGSGAEALSTIPCFHPDLVLLDVMMPDLDGPETLRLIRDTVAGHFLPVVFITARARKSDLEYLGPFGPAGVITKPFEPLDLAKRLQAIWAGLSDNPAADE